MRGERKEEEWELSDEVGGERIIWRKEAEGKYAGSIAKKLSREESWEARGNKWERIKEIIWETAREEGLVKKRESARDGAERSMEGMQVAKGVGMCPNSPDIQGRG
ncbi:hypothetical protein PV326_006376 [Microctonus aethiopoides]|nr:hypothetical protein PV326_006376 [Microctonus aethiopoides]